MSTEMRPPDAPATEINDLTSLDILGGLGGLSDMPSTTATSEQPASHPQESHSSGDGDLLVDPLSLAGGALVTAGLLLGSRVRRRRG